MAIHGWTWVCLRRGNGRATTQRCRPHLGRTELFAKLQLFAVYAQGLPAASFAPVEAVDKRHGAERAALSQREIECLRWSSVGKTSREIGRILSLSESLVATLLGSAQTKLGCFSKQHAIASALRARIIL
jgi:DNA-binding CsgD family transcriptional regulator